MHQLNTENLAKVLELLCVLYISGGDQGAIRRRLGGDQEAIRKRSGGNQEVGREIIFTLKY